MSSGSVVAGMCRLLAAAGCGAYAEDTALPEGQVPIAVGLSPPDGDLAVTVATYTGGPEPDARNAWEYPRMQVKVRAANPLDALELDRQCFDALQATSGDLPDTSWHLQDCYALNSEAQPLGPDDNGRHEYVRNYQLSVEPAS